MFLRILKKDLQRKKTMNLILVLFIILASMFVSAGLNNVITVANGTDFYLDQAGIGDVTFLTMGDDSTGHMEKYLKDHDAVAEYRIETVVYGSNDNIFLDNDEAAKTNKTTIFQPIEEARLNYFDREDQVVSDIQEGHVYVNSSAFMRENKLEVGDRIRIIHNEARLDLILDGKVKDALLGSDIMGNVRFFLNEKDYQKLTAEEMIRQHYMGEIGYVDLKDGAQLEYTAADIPGVGFEGSRTTIKFLYVMDMIVAFLVLILSICLIIVSFMVLRFSIHFNMQEEFREIGVMKAIGLKNMSIRRLYLSKYLLLSVVGGGIGFLASIPFSALLMRSVTENMLLGNSFGILINVGGTLFVILVILAFAYGCTGKVKKWSPIDAIRSGQTGERYRKKTWYRIERSHIGANLYMALNDIVSSPKRFATILITFFICTLFVLMIVNTAETMDSPNLIDTFGARSDVYVTNVSEVMKQMGNGTKEEYKKYLDEQAEELTKLGMPAKAHAETQFKYTVTYKGKKYMLSCQQGMNTTMELYRYTEGKMPVSKAEIAITPQISRKTGAKIGDELTIDFGTEQIDCMVTAYFESMNNLGELIRLHPDAPTDFQYVSSIMQTQFDFLDHPSQEEIDSRRDRLKDYYGTDEVWNATEYCVDSTGGVVDILRGVQYLLTIITILVIVLVTILMERSFIADEKSQIALLKAIGFRSKDVIRWQVFRFGAIALLAVLLSAAFSIPMTRLCITPIFGMMGATEFQYNIVWWKIFGFYPGVMVAVTVLVAWLTALYTKRITSRDTANIE